MVQGLNYPRGILAWADEIGLDHVLRCWTPWRSNAARTATGRLRCCAASAGRAASAARPGRGSSSTGRTDRCSRCRSRPLDGLRRASGGRVLPQPSNTQDRLRGCRLPPSLDVCSVASGSEWTTDRDRRSTHVRRRHGQGAAGGDSGWHPALDSPWSRPPSLTWALASKHARERAYPRGHCRHARTPIVAATHRQLDRAVICLVNRQRRKFGLPRLRQSRRLDRSAQDWTNFMVSHDDFSHWVELRRTDQRRGL